MAVTVGTLLGNQGMQSSSRPMFFYKVPVTLDASYPTGGYTSFSSSLAAKIGLGKSIVAILPAGNCGGYVPSWDATNDTLQIYWGAAGQGANTEVTNATDLSAVTVQLLVLAA